MKLSNYKTDKQKIGLIVRSGYTKNDLFSMCEETGIDTSDCQTKKELLEKHLDDIWELVLEDYYHS